jgi:hypothetical protein
MHSQKGNWITSSCVCGEWEERKKFRCYNVIFLCVIAQCIMGFTILSRVHHDTFKSRLDPYSSLFETVLMIICGKVKVKLSLCVTNQAHEGVWGSGCIDPHFLDLGTSWR